MVYLGLQDDDEFDFDADYDEYDYEDAAGAPARERTPTRVPRDTSDVHPLHGDQLHEAVEPPPMPRSESGLVRPVPRDEPSSLMKPRPAVVRHQTSAPLQVVEPSGFNDAQELGDRLKANQPVVLNLRGLDRDLQRRLIDFSSGLAYAVGGTMRKVDDQVFLLTPTSVEVSEEDKEQLQARGLYRA
ncbi:MAG TPA: cell division protein SepF [Acidimicrobiia bacterium]|jgi:cell division inhibitor SepF